VGQTPDSEAACTVVDTENASNECIDFYEYNDRGRLHGPLERAFALQHEIAVCSEYRKTVNNELLVLTW
jgi:hypothetical protein